MSDERDPTQPLVPEDEEAWPPPEPAEVTAADEVEFWPPVGEAPDMRTHPAADPGQDTVVIEPEPTTPIEPGVQVHHAPPVEQIEEPQTFGAPGAREHTAAELEALRALARRALEPSVPEDPAAPEEPVGEETRLPSIEELTFSRPSADLPHAASPEILAPKQHEIRARTLSQRRVRTLAAFADTVIPHGGVLEPSATDAGVPQRLDALVANFDPGARRTLERFLTFFEWASLFTRTLRPFSKLAPEKRLGVVARASKSKLFPRRAAVDLLKFFTANLWASTPVIEERLGFTYGCESATPPRDGERLEVLGFPQIDRDHAEECDVVVVGSGAGGAVVAKELAELGLSVIVIEEGAYFTRADFTGPPFERFLRFYRKQGMTVALGSPAIPLPMGMAVGGTTVVNSGTCFRTPDRVLQRWEREFSLPQIDPESMRPFFDRVEKIQRVQPVPEELLGNNARMFRRGVETLGLHGSPIRRNIEGCRGCGVCAFGCPSDAKQAMHLSYLPRAQRSGATIYANTKARTIVVRGGRAAGITAELLDPRSREPKATLHVSAKLVVLAAGAVHTPAVLSENALGNTSGQLGRNLRIHPAAGVGAFFDEEVFGWRGTLQPYFVDDWHESHDIMIEVTSSIPSMGTGSFPGFGAGLKEIVARYPHLATAGLFVSDTSSGRVIPRRGREPLITYKLNRADTRRMVRGVAHTAEILLAAGARAVLTGLPGIGPVSGKDQLVDLHEEAVKPGALKLSAFHPVGTARMGADPGSSVVGPYGEVHGVDGLFVADASVLPGCPTVNPQITIMAFATRTPITSRATPLGTSSLMSRPAGDGIAATETSCRRNTMTTETTESEIRVHHDEIVEGAVAPDFELRDTEGQPVKLSDFRETKNVLLLFYPFAFSGVCTTEFCQLRDQNADLVSDENLEVIGISTDPVFALRAWKAHEKYPNRFVSDFWPHGAVSKAYNAFNDKVGMSLRHAFLIDKQGIVRLVQRNETREARDQDLWRAKLNELA